MPQKNNVLLVDDQKAIRTPIKYCLKQKGYKPVTFFAKSAGHNEREWAKRIWRPLTQFFGGSE